MGKWTVTPERVRLELECGGEPLWIDVKKRLNKGEAERVRTAGFRAVSAAPSGPARAGEARDRDPQIVVDWAAQSMARTVEYLLDWSLADENGNKLPLSPPSRKLESLNALREDVYEAIENAITAHVEALDREKKATTGAP